MAFFLLVLGEKLAESYAVTISIPDIQDVPYVPDIFLGNIYLVADNYAGYFLSCSSFLQACLLLVDFKALSFDYSPEAP